MIELGLTRITSLLRGRPQPWKAIHVAGTNGKGSICAYIMAMLRAGGVRCGRFTSPHLIDRWDCINIDGKPISRDAFTAHEDYFKRRNEAEKIGASEFELLTACAFEAFTAAGVQVGVVEVGMGGRLDATNVLEKPIVTVISKIGLDHQAFLGDTIEAIAKEKAGILKPGVPCVVNGQNEASVIAVIRETAREVGAEPLILRDALPKISSVQKDAWTPTWGPVKGKWDQFVTDMRDERSQRQNISCAYGAVQRALPRLDVPMPSHDLLPAVMTARLPGRLQVVDISSIVGRKQSILLDGAHNPDSAMALNVKTFSTYRKHPGSRKSRQTGNFVVGIRDGYGEGKPVTWVLAFTEGKDVKEILQTILRRNDRVVLTRFSAVDGMPWVNAMQPAEIEATINTILPGVTVSDGGGIREALQAASDIADGGNMVVAGSLYLVSDVLRLWSQVTGAEAAGDAEIGEVYNRRHIVGDMLDQTGPRKRQRRRAKSP